MTKAEDRVINFFVRHRILLGYLFITLLNLYLRKVAVWWSMDEVVSFYDGHDHGTQGELWHLIMKFGLHFPILPLHFMKWFSAIGDFLMAAAGAVYLSNVNQDDNPGRLDSGLIFFSIVLIMPFTIIRGIVMSMTDSFGIFFIILGHCLLKSKKLMISAYIIGILLCPALLLPLCLDFYFDKNNESGFLMLGLTFFLVMVLSGCMGLINGPGFLKGLSGQINYLFFDKYTGMSYINSSEWMISMFQYYSLPVAVMGLLLVIKHKVTAI